MYPIRGCLEEQQPNIFVLASTIPAGKHIAKAGLHPASAIISQNDGISLHNVLFAVNNLQPMQNACFSKRYVV